MTNLCVNTAVDVDFSRDRSMKDKRSARLISRRIKIGPRIWLLVAWAASSLLFLGFSLALDHGVATTQSDSVLCKRH